VSSGTEAADLLVNNGFSLFGSWIRHMFLPGNLPILLLNFKASLFLTKSLSTLLGVE
jgi:hypothetical protein